ncbi:MAG: DUF4080 domain-containing protein [Lentisphaeria bacterium]|nr:DUF4080 domain-containing protein [Lentisphaeria bacterium]
MLRIVWLDVNASHSHSSLALPILHRSCESLPCEWHVVPHSLKTDPAHTACRIVDLRPDVVLATLYLFTRRTVLDVLVRAKKLYPDCFVVVGGPECLGDNRDLVAGACGVDAAVRGEGDLALPALLQARIRGEDCTRLSGFCLQTPQGTYVDNGYAEKAENPFACQTPLGKDPFFKTAGPFAILETARGCPGKCMFCTSCGDLPVRNRPLEDVEGELRELCATGIREIRVLDRTFNLVPDRSCSLLRLFRTQFPDTRFHLEIHPEFLTPREQRELAEFAPGKLHLEIGIQCTEEQVLHSVHRGQSANKALEGLAFLTSLPGVQTHTDLIAGLPGQTWQHVLQDVLTMLQAAPDEIQLEVLKVLPGTPLDEQKEVLGLVSSPVTPYEILRTDTMMATEVLQAKRLSRLLDEYYNESSLRIAFILLVRQIADLAHLLRWHECTSPEMQPRALEKRFQSLFTLAEGHEDLRDELRMGWMGRGFSPTHGICDASVWKHSVPIHAEKLWDDTDTADTTRLRVWHVFLDEGEAWFAYNRGKSQHRPVAAWTTRRNGVRQNKRNENET